jgi:hypothetical protein
MLRRQRARVAVFTLMAAAEQLASGADGGENLSQQTYQRRS